MAYEKAADPHALLQYLHAPPLPRTGAAELDGGNERDSLPRRLQDELAGNAESDGPVRILGSAGDDCELGTQAEKA
jgi:hypothetical protein